MSVKRVNSCIQVYSASYGDSELVLVMDLADRWLMAQWSTAKVMALAPKPRPVAYARTMLNGDASRSRAAGGPLSARTSTRMPTSVSAHMSGHVYGRVY